MANGLRLDGKNIVAREQRERLTLTPEQWVGLINTSGKWLPICCASVSSARDILIDALRRDGWMSTENAKQLRVEIAHHDCFRYAFGEQVENPPKEPTWAIDEGSPWPTIARVTQAIIDAGDKQ